MDMMMERLEERITPARAGKSLTAQVVRLCSRDHPRACGEEAVKYCGISQMEGSPPRVRGRAMNIQEATKQAGITPARAGKSSRRRATPPAPRDHPRACGEE